MEIVIIVAIWSVVVKRGVEDIIHAARGNTPHRYAAARKPATSGAWGRYLRALSDDVAADLLQRHNEGRARRASRPPKPTVGDRWKYGRLRFRSARWNAHNRFKRAVAPLVRRWDEKLRERTTRPRPSQDTVPGEVVPNQDEHQDEHQDEPAPDSRTAQDENDSTDQDGIRLCPGCGGRLATVGPLCPSCLDRAEDEADLRRYPPDSGPDNQTNTTPEGDTQGSPDTQEGPTTMTATTTEAVGLSGVIRFCEDSAGAFRAQAQATEQTAAAIDAGGVSGPAAAKLAHAMELSMAAAEAMDEAAAEFRPHLGIQEQYNANPGAGTREFVTAGQ